MPKIYTISDLHLGHKKILELSKGLRAGSNVEEHDQWIIDQWNSVITKRDCVYVLGDIAFGKPALEKTKQLKGFKKLILGNHDKFKASEYADAGFDIISSVHRFKKYWMSHAPIHPCELRGLMNIHGHMHNECVPNDHRYLNVCVEKLNAVPFCLTDLINEGM